MPGARRIAVAAEDLRAEDAGEGTATEDAPEAGDGAAPEDAPDAGGDAEDPPEAGGGATEDPPEAVHSSASEFSGRTIVHGWPAIELTRKESEGEANKVEASKCYCGSCLTASWIRGWNSANAICTALHCTALHCTALH